MLFEGKGGDIPWDYYIEALFVFTVSCYNFFQGVEYMVWGFLLFGTFFLPLVMEIVFSHS
jgi:hypothetical protein